MRPQVRRQAASAEYQLVALEAFVEDQPRLFGELVIFEKLMIIGYRFF
jgi:hypothetical protein